MPMHLEHTKAVYQEKNDDLTDASATPQSLALPFDGPGTKRLLRKLDLHLIPFLALIYL
jgi:hypothetical protein